jgi:tetratricopeptide (TPR) repeat protein
MTTTTTSTDDNDNKNKKTLEDDPPPELPFVTTSDVMKELNKNLKELSLPGESFEPRVDLQKRLPDGSTIPASEQDLAYSDLQTKLQQSAAFVSQLEENDKKRWAEEQRAIANVYFQRGDYKTAMDVYLTCLVVKDESLDFLRQTLIPVLTNLAQCTLQLGMHKKTMMFCNIALEELKKFPDQEDNNNNNNNNIALCKLHFKRAKANRLTGDYGTARDDLNRCLEYCLREDEEEQKNKGDTTTATTTAPYQQAIQKEFRHLETAEKEARKNRQRQKQAMQKVLSSSKGTTTEKTTTSLFDKEDEEEASKGRPRQYSSLRRKTLPKSPNASSQPPTNQAAHVLVAPQLSYWQYYWLVVARVSETLLVWMGDEETKEKIKLELQQETTTNNDEKHKDE